MTSPLDRGRVEAARALARRSPAAQIPTGIAIGWKNRPHRRAVARRDDNEDATPREDGSRSHEDYHAKSMPGASPRSRLPRLRRIPAAKPFSPRDGPDTIAVIILVRTHLLLDADGVDGGGGLDDDGGAAGGLAGASRNARGESNLAGGSESSHCLRVVCGVMIAASAGLSTLATLAPLAAVADFSPFTGRPGGSRLSARSRPRLRKNDYMIKQSQRFEICGKAMSSRDFSL